jgi:drug/metabolite transporter (DMT)-like permease
MSATSVAPLLLALASVLLSAMAQLLMKVGMGRLRLNGALDGSIVDAAGRAALDPWVIGGLAAYGVSAALWLGVLSRTPLSVAYPLVSLGVATVAAMSWLLLGEPLSPRQLGGLLLILIGVAMAGWRN